jgi:DNA-binding CsgD family transcriptional regulator
VNGRTLPEIAVRTGRSHHTLRAQLRSVLAKTGVHRQAELLQLLAAL